MGYFKIFWVILVNRISMLNLKETEVVTFRNQLSNLKCLTIKTVTSYKVIFRLKFIVIVLFFLVQQA